MQGLLGRVVDRLPGARHGHDGRAGAIAALDVGNRIREGAGRDARVGVLMAAWSGSSAASAASARA